MTDMLARPAVPVLLALSLAAAGCAGSGPAKGAGRPPVSSAGWDLPEETAPASARVPAGGFPKGWELSKEEAAPPADGFPEGWALPEEAPEASAAEAAAEGSVDRGAAAGTGGGGKQTGTAAVAAAAAASSTVASEGDLAKARIQVGKAGNLLGRLKATGYHVLVKDDIAVIEALIGDASRALAAGDAAGTRRITDDAARRLQKAKTRIESETRQPLRW